MLEMAGVKIFLSGDGGYYTHFKEIGEKFGGIDVAIQKMGNTMKRGDFHTLLQMRCYKSLLI